MYLPEFLAMYNIRQSREYLTAVTQNQSPDIESQIEQAVGGIPETAEEAQDYLNGAWQGMVDGRGAVNLDLFRMANLKSIIEGASIDGAVKISTERTSNKLSITLETVGSDIWEDIFGIDEELNSDPVYSRIFLTLLLSNEFVEFRNNFSMGWYRYIRFSPVSWTTLDKVDVGGMTEYPSFYYCIAVYIALIVILSAFIIVHIRNSSLEKEVF